MMELITRSKIMKGKSLTSDIKTEEGIFRIRQLTIGEKGEADCLMTEGLISTGIKGVKVTGIEGSTKSFVNNLLEYNCYIIACALSLGTKKAEIWTPQNIKDQKWSEATVKVLIKAIEAFSGMGKREGEAAEQVNGFRKNPRRNKTGKDDSTRKS